MNAAFFVVALVLFAPASYDALLMSQQNGYGSVRNRKFYLRYAILAGIAAVSALASAFFGNAVKIALFALSAAAAAGSGAERFVRARGKIAATRRLKRLALVSFFLYAACVVALFRAAPPGALAVAPALACPAVLLSALLLCPLEKRNNLRYVAMLRKKLAASPRLIRVGITGSAGKTSVKNILYEMLASRYRVLKTDRNYNTPLGLWLTVKDENLDRYDIFIAEMGARKAGDIKELTELVEPDLGIVTAVLPQHLETFGSLAAVKAEKSELVRGIVSGIVVLNTDDENVAAMEDDTLAEVVRVGKTGGYRVTDLVADYRGASFTLSTPLGAIELKTELLGAHNAQNIALAAAAAMRFGIPKEDIRFAVANLRPVPHRLELTKTPGGIFVLDDGYNSNPAGADEALRIVGTFPGRRVVFSQGLVELGAEEGERNRALGRRIAEVADVLILTGRLGAYITEGATERMSTGISDGSSVGSSDESPIRASGGTAVESQTCASGGTSNESPICASDGTSNESPICASDGTSNESPICASDGTADCALEIHRVRDVKEGRELFEKILAPGDLLYLQNDLPELYR